MEFADEPVGQEERAEQKETGYGVFLREWSEKSVAIVAEQAARVDQYNNERERASKAVEKLESLGC